MKDEKTQYRYIYQKLKKTKMFGSEEFNRKWSLADLIYKAESLSKDQGKVFRKS